MTQKKLSFYLGNVFNYLTFQDENSNSSEFLSSFVKTFLSKTVLNLSQNNQFIDTLLYYLRHRHFISKENERLQRIGINLVIYLMSNSQSRPLSIGLYVSKLTFRSNRLLKKTILSLISRKELEDGKETKMFGRDKEIFERLLHSEIVPATRAQAIEYYFSPKEEIAMKVELQDTLPCALLSLIGEYLRSPYEYGDPVPRKLRL